MQSLVKRIGYFLKDESTGTGSRGTPTNKYYIRYFLLDNDNNFYCTSSYARLEFLIKTSDKFSDLFRNAKNNLKLEKQTDYKLTEIKSYPQPEAIPFLNQKYFEMHVSPNTENDDAQSIASKKTTKSSNPGNKANKITLYIFAFKDDHLQHMHNFFKHYSSEVEKRGPEERNMHVNSNPQDCQSPGSSTYFGDSIHGKFFKDKQDQDSDGSLNELAKTLILLLEKLKEIEKNTKEYDDDSIINSILPEKKSSKALNKKKIVSSGTKSPVQKPRAQTPEKSANDEKSISQTKVPKDTTDKQPETKPKTEVGPATAESEAKNDNLGDGLEFDDMESELHHDAKRSINNLYDHACNLLSCEQSAMNEFEKQEPELEKSPTSSISNEKQISRKDTEETAQTEKIAEAPEETIQTEKIPEPAAPKEPIVEECDDLNKSIYKEHEEQKLISGSTYSGPTVNGVPDGKGKEFMLNGVSYVGEFRNGKKHGVGYIVDTELMCYVEYINGKVAGI